MSHLPPSLTPLLERIYGDLYPTMNQSQRANWGKLVQKIQLSPGEVHLSKEDDLFVPLLNLRQTLFTEGNNTQYRLLDQILGFGRSTGGGSISDVGASNDKKILAFPHMTGPNPTIPAPPSFHHIQTEGNPPINSQIIGFSPASHHGLSRQPTECEVIQTGNPFMDEMQPTAASLVIPPSTTEFSPQAGLVTADQFSRQKTGTSPPLNPFNTEGIYQSSSSRLPTPPPLELSGLDHVRKEVQNLSIENDKPKSSTSFEQEVANGETAKRSREVEALLFEKLAELTGKRPSQSVSGGTAQKKVKTDQKDVWKSGISRSRKNNLTISSNFENDMTVYDSDAISIYCGFGFPVIDKPGKNDDCNDDSRKRATYPSFYLRTETNDFNSCVQLKAAQIELVIETLQLSYALTTKKLLPSEFIPENDSPEMRKRIIQMCSHPISERAISNQFTMIHAARESENATIIN